MIDLLSDPQAWASLLTLTLLEVVLGIDNVIFLSIVSGRLPPAQQPRARVIGLGLAAADLLGVRAIGLLAGYRVDRGRPVPAGQGHYGNPPHVGGR